jgi:uroporphyrinogen-III decarboxylase
MNVENWVLAKAGISLPPNPDNDPEIHLKNIAIQRDAVEEYFSEVNYQRLVSDISVPGVSCGRNIVQGELLGAEVDEKTDTNVSHPWKSYKSVEEIDKIEVPDLRKCEGFKARLFEYKKIAAKYNDVVPGKKAGFLSGQYGMAVGSPLNFTLEMVGEELFILMFTDPELVHAFFRKTMQIHEMFWEVKQEVEECEYTRSYLGDCSNTMLSPETFKEFVLPCNKRFAEKFPATESHNCGVVSHLLDSIAQYGPFAWIELGWGTDLTESRKHFGEQILLPRLGVSIMQEYSPDQVYESISDILIKTAIEGPAALHSNCIDIDKTSEDSLKAVFSAVDDFERKN